MESGGVWRGGEVSAIGNPSVKRSLRSNERKKSERRRIVEIQAEGVVVMHRRSGGKRRERKRL